MKAVLLCLILLNSCTSLVKSVSPKEGKSFYSYVDAAGKFTYGREHKLIKNKIVSRAQIILAQGGSQKILEKTITVSQLGTVKDKKSRVLVTRPYAAEFTVWLEGKNYSSKMRLDQANKAMLVELSSPEEKWRGNSSIPFPKGKQFCFFAQIPDCLYHNLYLSRALAKKNEGLSFWVVWEGYPYIQDQLVGVGKRLFSLATLKYEGEAKSQHRYSVEVDGQTVLYYFSKSFDLVRMLWIAQGISILPPGEEAEE